MSEFMIDVRTRNDLQHIGRDARVAEEMGYDGAVNAETNGDPFPGLTLMAQQTQRIMIAPAIAVAFARTPMTTAYLAYQLQGYSDGRFVLGLGSQIRAHIERRYSMPWSQPAARMADYIAALRAIWATWDGHGPLQYEGEFYSHTLMPPAAFPPRHEFGEPKIFLAAMNPRMLEVTGRLADGLFVHSFMTDEYLRDVIVPTVRAAQAAAGRPAAAVQIAASTFVALDEADLEAVRRQISFYASTQAYRPVLESRGWGELQTELHTLSKANRWDDMVPLVSDELVDAMCVSGTASEIAAGIRRRFAGVADRVDFYVPGVIAPPERYAEVVSALRG